MPVLVLMGNAPGTPQARDALRLVDSLAHAGDPLDLVLVQDGVLLARRHPPVPLIANVTYHVLNTDLQLRGIRPEELRQEVRLISGADLVTFMLDGTRRVIGIL